MYQLNPLLENKQVVKEEFEPVGAAIVGSVILGKIAAAIGDSRKSKACIKILEAYPNPKTLYKKLKQYPKTVQLAESLSNTIDFNSWTGSEDNYFVYAHWILKNILHYFGVLKYLATVIGGPISLAYQIIVSASTKNRDADKWIFGKNTPNENSQPENNKVTKTKLTNGQKLMIVLEYIEKNLNKDPDLIAARKEFEEAGGMFGMVGNYTNLYLCYYTCLSYIAKYNMNAEDLAKGSKSAKRLLSWGKKKNLIK